MLRALDRAEEWLTATLLAAMTLLTFLQVVLRYGFNSGLIWSLETTVYLFTWLVLLGISGGVRNDRHIAVEFVTDRLPTAARKMAALMAIGFTLLYAALMFIGSWALIGRLYDFGSLAHDIPLPRWLLLSALPIGFALLGLRIGQAALAIWNDSAPTAGGRDQAGIR
jgi:C4-dicarboxylate transporter DctQ subunit